MEAGRDMLEDEDGLLGPNIVDWGTITCPQCGGHMVSAMGVMVCVESGSLFLEKNTLENILGVVLKEEKLPEGESKMSCPGCGGKMYDADFVGEKVSMSPCGKCLLTSDAFLDISRKVSSGSVPKEEMTVGASFLQKMNIVRNVGQVKRGRKEAINVDGLFVLYKSGLLLSSYTSDMAEEMDPDIMGSMLMAITGFVQTSFRDMGGQLLDSIRFENMEIAFEQGQYLVVALKAKGGIPRWVRDRLSATLREIEANNREILESWTGNMNDMSPLISSFDALLTPVSRRGI